MATGIKARIERATLGLVGSMVKANETISKTIAPALARAMLDLRVCFTTADKLVDFGGRSSGYRDAMGEVKAKAELQVGTDYESLRVMASGYYNEHLAELVKAHKSASVLTQYEAWTEAQANRKPAKPTPKSTLSILGDTTRKAVSESRKSKTNPNGVPQVFDLLTIVNQTLGIIREYVAPEGEVITLWKPNSGDLERWVGELDTVVKLTATIGTALREAEAKLAEASKTPGSKRDPRTGGSTVKAEAKTA
jgi:hypothetical protein